MKRTQAVKKQSKPSPKETRRTRSRAGGDETRKRTHEAEGDSSRFWMRCPRCGLGLIETVHGAITTERCTACGAVWADRRDVEKMSEDEGAEVFRL